MQPSFRPPAVHAMLVDQSAAMAVPMDTGRTKAEYAAAEANRSLHRLIIRCTRGDGVRDDFRVIALGHEDGEPRQLLPVPGLISPSTLQQSVRHLAQRTVTFRGAVGEEVIREVQDPVWILPESAGPYPIEAMARKLRDVLAPWCAAHPDTYPPVIHHVTGSIDEADRATRALAVLADLGTDFGAVRCHTVEIGASGPLLARQRSATGAQ